MTKALWGSWSVWEGISAYMVQVLMLGRYNRDFSKFTIAWKGENSLEKFRAVWSTEKGEENSTDEMILNALTEIFTL